MSAFGGKKIDKKNSIFIDSIIIIFVFFIFFLGFKSLDSAQVFVGVWRVILDPRSHSLVGGREMF